MADSHAWTPIRHTLPAQQFAPDAGLARPISLASYPVATGRPLPGHQRPRARKGEGKGLTRHLEVRAIKAVIPQQSTRKVKRACDFALYAERNLVERFFNAIKHYRGIATRYEKTARNFLAGLHLVCALAWLK
jgi:transposase